MSNSTPFTAIRAIFRSACISYSVIVLFLCFVLTGLSENAASAVAPMNFLLIFPFAVSFAVANYVHRKTGISGILKFLLHFLLTVGGFFVFLYLPAFSGSGASSSMIVLAVFAVCYLAVYGIVLLFRKRWKKEFYSDEDYAPQFSGKDRSSSSSKR